MTLYSYSLRIDDGAAPNPYGGICTLAICKPAIRRTSEIGDWVVGLGSVNSPIGDVSDCVVYAMKVSEKVRFQKYEFLCKTMYPIKIPNWSSKKFEERVGDCIYDFSNGGILPVVRKSVHDESNREKDLSGIYVLLSDHFYYFGDKPIKLPQTLLGIIHDQQGHKSKLNESLIEPFVNWIEGLGLEVNKLYGEPQLKDEIQQNPDMPKICSMRDLDDDD